MATGKVGMGERSPTIRGDVHKPRTEKIAPKSGQSARIEALREARTVRVKAALAAASLANALFRST